MIPEEQGESGFTIRALGIAVMLTILLVATSSYIALKIGALPWPIIFSVIVAGAALKMFKTSIHEINVAQAGGTIGGLMASGVVFTIPGIIYLQQTKGLSIPLPSWWALALICITGGALGVLLSIPVRRAFIDEENLPYPSGAAGAEVLKAEFHGGTHAYLVAFVGLLTGIFALSRDLWFPGGIALTGLAVYGIYFTLYPMPLGVGIGYILGPKASVNSWFLGSVIGWVIIIPYLVHTGFTGDGGTLVQELGMGFVLGSGVGFFVGYVIPKAKAIFLPLFRWKGAPWYTRFTPIGSVIAFLVLVAVGVPVLASILSVAGVWIMATVAARMTGETNIDPLEQFGIIIGLLCLGIYAAVDKELGYLPAFMLVCFVSVAAALAGDIGHDYKSAQILNTRPKDIIKVDFICAIAAGIMAPIILKIIVEGYSAVLFTPEMPAPQAVLVAGSIFGFKYPSVFLTGFGIAFVLEVLQRATKKTLPVSFMAFGIGMFLGLTFGFLFFIGGIIRWYTDRKAPHVTQEGILTAAGLMGGEGIAGFVSGAIFVAGLSRVMSLQVLLLVFVVLLVITTGVYMIRRSR
ncbi:MAG: OPT/YSL family transporter [Theionarchaea archaeon]|nr:OPT/YSL family transporter [Theionarchaea archaeon]MBU7000514.1 OPT/YSL family transporter [Theionarchaea archaeon]MBU7021557.1 OPT/YSL family transporter [Theionarchaea archaeon]MBU7034088.1 OPT/YSL family transporter [Theionarchaea archaeon]MBU7039927.1 OPT/YSL family transporter [Theionarchaea archaeon]